MRKFDLSLRSSRSSYFATFRHQLTILSKTDALDEEKWLNMLGTFVKDWFRYESHFVHGRDRKSGSAGMPRPISYAVFCLKKKMLNHGRYRSVHHVYRIARRSDSAHRSSRLAVQPVLPTLHRT